MTEETAINVKEQCAGVYYDNFRFLRKDMKNRISCYMLDAIFKNMVVPAIDTARRLDRVERIVALDEQNGTPCEQIRHQQEIETLSKRIEILENELGRDIVDEALGDA